MTGEVDLDAVEFGHRPGEARVGHVTSPGADADPQQPAASPLSLSPESMPSSPTPSEGVEAAVTLPVTTQGNHGIALAALAVVRLRAKQGRSRGTQALVHPEPAAVAEREPISLPEKARLMKIIPGATEVKPIEAEDVPTFGTSMELGPRIEVPRSIPALDDNALLEQYVRSVTRENLLADASTQTDMVESWFATQRRAIMAMLVPTGPNSDKIGAAFNLSNSIVGAGILGLANYFAKAGLVLGIILLIVQCLLMLYTASLIVRVARAENADSYGKIAELTLGIKGGLVTQLLVIINTVGSLIAYVVLIRGFVTSTAQIFGADDDFPDTTIANVIIIIIVYGTKLSPTTPRPLHH